MTEHVSPSIELIDPLPDALLSAIRASETNVLATSRLLYGERREISALAELVHSRLTPGKIGLVDLVCLQSMAERSRLQPLADVASEVPVVAAISEALYARSASALVDNRIPHIVVAPSGTVAKVLWYDFDSASREFLESRGVAVGGDYSSLYKQVRSSRLLSLAKGALRSPPKERRYLRLGDGTWANKWINLKQIVADPRTVSELAYYLARDLTGDFAEEIPENGYVVGNNTSLVLATYLQRIIGGKRRIHVIDRLGPFPHLSKLRMGESRKLVGKSLLLVEDVISTGRETDLVSLFCFLNNASVVRVASIYDLGVARSLLMTPKSVHSLSRPSEQLNYERVAAFMERGD